MTDDEIAAEAERELERRTRNVALALDLTKHQADILVAWAQLEMVRSETRVLGRFSSILLTIAEAENLPQKLRDEAHAGYLRWRDLQGGTPGRAP